MKKSLHEKNIETILKLRKDGMTYEEISNWVGYSASQIGVICRNRKVQKRK